MTTNFIPARVFSTRPAVLCACIFIACGDVFARVPDAEAQRIASAIYLAEGGKKARVPFGIESIKVSGYENARRICINTIQNNHDRWIEAGSPGEYLDFLSRRYCPLNSAVWLKNVRYFLKGNR